MDDSHIFESLLNRSFQISYVFLRIADVSRNPAFSTYLSSYGFDLVDRSASRDFRGAAVSLLKAEYLLRLGLEIQLIDRNSFDTLEAEIKALNSAMLDYLNNSAKLPDFDLESIFSSTDLGVKKPDYNFSSFSRREQGQEAETAAAVPAGPESHKQTPIEATVHYRDEKNKSFSKQSLTLDSSSLSEGSSIGFSGEMRQSAILGKIRQNGYCRLKEIQEVLPDVSERTLRYDLQKLIDRNLVERIGSGGPASFYRLKRKEE